MDASFIQWLLGQTGIAGIAGLALYMLQRTYKDSLTQALKSAQESRDDRVMLMEVLREVTKALTGLQAVVETSIREQRNRRDQDN